MLMICIYVEDRLQYPFVEFKQVGKDRVLKLRYYQEIG